MAVLWAVAAAGRRLRAVAVPIVAAAAVHPEQVARVGAPELAAALQRHRSRALAVPRRNQPRRSAGLAGRAQRAHAVISTALRTTGVSDVGVV